ncbi:ninjurin-2-like [Ptychodera flava]|uniref:ninjurin-2-like n=1 Tax=Ptychodera flava TaxID=63121 RepID=UPI00396A29E4
MANKNSNKVRHAEEDKTTDNDIVAVAVDVKDKPATAEKAPSPKDLDFDHNTYETKKTVTQALFLLALLSANAAHLRILIARSNISPGAFVLSAVLLGLSIALQLAAGALLFLAIRLNINKEEQRATADRVNDRVTFVILTTTILNIFIAAFGGSY